MTDLFFIGTQVFTGEVPFHPYPPAVAMLAILDGKRPARPTHPNLTDELWAFMRRCWNQDPHLRPEMPLVFQKLRGSSVSRLSRRQHTSLTRYVCSDPPSGGPFSSYSASDSASSQTLLEFTDPGTDKSPKSPEFHPSSTNRRLGSGNKTPSPANQDESMGRGEGGSTQPSGSPPAGTRNSWGSENDSEHGGVQGEHPSRRTSRSRSPRGASQSEPQTPLPIDPPQLDPGQLPNPIYHHPDWTNKPHANPRTGPGKNDESKEGPSGPRVDGVSPDNDPKDDTGGTHGPGSQGDDCGTHRASGPMYWLRYFLT